MRLFFLACLALVPALASATQVKIDSTERNTTWIGAVAVDRQVRWSPRDKALIAVVTFDNTLHADSATAGARDDLYFTFPGTEIDPATGIVSVTAENGDKIAVGEWRKGLIGHRFSLYQCALFIVHRQRGAISLTLDVDTERKAEVVRKQQEAAETENVSLDQLIHPKN